MITAMTRESGSAPASSAFDFSNLPQTTSFPGADDELAALLDGIARTTICIQARVARAKLDADRESNRPPMQNRVDAFGNAVPIYELDFESVPSLLISADNTDPVVVRTLNSANSNYKSSSAARGQLGYAVIFSPLDGAANMDVNSEVGTIFSIVNCPDGDETVDWMLRPGRQQVAAGYAIYGSATTLVYTTGKGVHGLTLDPFRGTYEVSHTNLRMPWRGKEYSFEEASRDSFPAEYREFLDELKSGYASETYESRYNGSVVADLHRTLIKGGVLAFPRNFHFPDGRLRLIYEANPLAMLAMQAGGVATDGCASVLDICPHEFHQHSPFIIGSRAEMELFCRCSARHSFV